MWAAPTGQMARCLALDLACTFIFPHLPACAHAGARKVKRDNWKVKRDNCVYTQCKRQSVSVSCCDSGQTNVVNTEGSSTHLPKDFTTTVCVLQQGSFKFRIF